LLVPLSLLGMGAVLAQSPPPAAFPGEAPPAPPADILVFRAETEAMDSGTALRLRWEAINAYEVAIQPDVGGVATFGTLRIAPSEPTRYTLEVTGAGGTVSESIVVDPVPGAERYVVAESGGSEVGRHADGTLDLSGVFIGGREIRMQGSVALTPEAEARAAAEAGTQNDLGTGIACLPPGVPSATMMPFPLQIVHKPDLVVILYEAYHLFRIIPIGREHPDYLDPTWMGYSVGHWDGDTLVVTVKGFNDRGLAAGNRHTTDMVVTERYTRLGPDAIRYEATIEDSAVFAEPVRYVGNLEARPEWEIGEYVCAENNKDYDELFSAD
jgi:hypothetical protein